MDLGEFYEKHKQYYYWKLNRKISGIGLTFHAEDIIHDVVVNMIANEKHRTKFECLAEPEAKAYFMACLTHRMIDIIRREKHCREYLEMVVEGYEKGQEMEELSAEMVVIERMNTESCMASVFQLLSAEERELLRLVYIEKLPYREIAKRGRLRESAIAMRVFRLRQKILKQYEKKSEEKIKFWSCKPEKPVLS